MDTTLLAFVVAAVGIAAAYAGVTNKDPRSILAGVLSGKRVDSPPLVGSTDGSTDNPPAGGGTYSTPQLQRILASLQSAGLLRDGRTCGVDTLAGEATSEHFYCNAKDLMVHSYVDGDRIAAYLESGLRSGSLPIHCIIWNRRILSRGGAVWTAYHGTNPHVDHVHVSGWPSVGGAC